MKKITLKKPNSDIPPKLFWLLFALLAAVRLLLTSCQRLQLDCETSMLDDMLMYKLATNISSGAWLGKYGYLTLSKRALYAVWLALLNKLGISVVLAGNVLAAAAAAAVCASLAPVIKKRWLQLAFFAVLVFSPNSFADFTLRVYRDNISTSFAMLFFAGALGLALRAGREGYTTRGLIGWAALGGISFGCCYLMREDAAWLFVVAVPTALIYAVRSLHGAKGRAAVGRLGALALSVALALGCVGAYAGMNYKYYGRFIVSDLTSSEFEAAYGAMTRVVVPQDEKNPIVPIPASTREKLAAACPSFAELMPYLESAEFSRWQKDCGDGEIDYSGGGFYWAVRSAASLLGYYETPQKAQEYFTRLADEINAAADSGALGEVLPERSGLNSPVTADYILPTLKESVSGLLRVVTYSGLRCEPEATSTGTDIVLDEMEEYLHCKAQRFSYDYSGSTERELVVWAVSEQGSVGVWINDGDGVSAAVDNTISTAGDIYLDFLFEGTDLLYTDGARHTIYYDSAKTGDGLNLVLSCGDTRIELAIDELGELPGEITTQGGITYRIEHYGEAAVASTRFGFAELWLYRIMRVVVMLYHIIGPVMFAGGTFALFYSAIIFIKRKRMFECGATFAMCLCTLFAAAIRIGMMAFADCSAFGLGLYSMYLAAVWPLMTVWETLAAACAVRVKRDGK